jgi:hypothetical protein
MDLFDRVFSNKEDGNFIPLRFQAGDNFQNIVNVLGINSFRIKVGDDEGNNTDKLVLVPERVTQAFRVFYKVH